MAEPKQVEQWQTVDGKTFDNYDDAVFHQCKAELEQFIHKSWNNKRGTNRGLVKDLAEYMFEHRIELFDILHSQVHEDKHGDEHG